MSGLKRLIHEIHRRSLSQVLAIYIIVGAAFGYQLIRLYDLRIIGLDGFYPAEA